MTPVALVLALTLPTQDPAHEPGEVLRRLEVPDIEEFLDRVPAASDFEEILSLLDRPAADALFKGREKARLLAHTMRMLGSREVIRTLEARAEAIEKDLGVDHPLLLEAGVALDHEILRSELSAAEKQRLREADSLVLAAQAAFHRGEFARSRQLFAGAIAGQLEFFEATSEPVARLCGEAAKAAAALEELASAQAWTVASAHLYAELYGPDHPAGAELLRQLGELRLRAGDRASAERLFLRSFQLLAESYGPRSYATWYACNGLGALYQEVGQLRDARTIWEASLGQIDHVDPALAAVLLDNLSVVLRDLNERGRAEEICRRALAIRRQLGAKGHADLAVSLHNLSSIVEVRGDLAEAEVLSREGVAIRERLLGASHPTTARAIGALGTLLQRRGDVDGALEYLSRAVEALRVSDHGRRGTDLALQLRNLASALIDAGRGGEARAAAAEALEIYGEEYGPDHRLTGQCHSTLGIAALMEGRYEAAAKELSEALRIARSSFGDDHVDVATEHCRLAHLDQRAGRLDSAKERLSEALRIVRLALPGSPFEARVLGLLGRIASEEGDFLGARRWLSAAFELTERRRTDIAGGERERALFSARLEHREISRELAWARAVEGDGSGSFDALARGRDRVLSDLLARASSTGADLRPALPFLAGALIAEERARDRVWALESRTDAEWSGGAALLEAAHRDVRTAEEATLAVLRERWPATQTATLDEVRSSLDPGELLCSFGWTPYGVLLLVVSPESDAVSVERVASGAAEVAELAEDVASISLAWARGDLARSETDGAARRLARTLLPESLRARVLAAERVILVPDGPLTALAFEALPVGEQGERWIEVGGELVFSTSAALFRDRRIRARGLERAGAPSLVAVGDPGRIEPVEASASKEALPGSSAEARSIGARFQAAGGDARILLAESAALPRVREAARTATHLHLGCHGIAASEADPFAAGLDLADGRWSLTELLRKDVGLLQRAELVVLAACESRRGRRLGDQDLALPWGFLAAGAPAVVASLWRVDDGATALLMDRFYANLLEGRAGGRSAAAALREAKLWLKGRTPAENRAAIAQLGIDSGRSPARPSRGEFGGPPGATEAPRAVAEPFDYSHPRYWAGFLILGAPD